MNRRLAFVAALVVASACTPPRADTGTPIMSPSARFDAWVAEHVVVAPPRPDGLWVVPWEHDPYQIHVDDAEIAGWDATLPGSSTWLMRHEQGHTVTYALGLTALMPPGPWLVQNEEAAQCVARVVLPDAVNPFIDAERGYWECDSDTLDAVRAALVAAGLWS